MTSLGGPLISVESLAVRLEDPGLVVVDCRHELLDPDAGERAYRDGHIPGARHAHLDRDLAGRPGPYDGRHPLPTPDELAATLRRLGISDSSWVVAYDAGNAGMAARLWWMLRWLGHERTSVLNGGYAAWRAGGFAIERGTRSWPPGSFAHGSPSDAWVVTASELQRLLERDEVVLLDARAPDRFAGLAEPIDPVAGHIPGARNMPFADLVDPRGLFLDPAALKARLLGASEARTAEHVVAMCGSGVTACQLLLAMEAAGLGMGRLYVGSWSEWIRDPARPVDRLRAQ